MTPKQRVAAARDQKKPDKLPIMAANSNTFICQYYDMTVRQFLTDVDLCTEGNRRFTEEFEVDYNLCVNGYILYGCGPELGCEWRFAGDNFPGFVSGPLQGPGDLKRIEVPDTSSGYFAHYLQVTRNLQEAIGDRYHLSVSILGPFAVACFLRGIQEALCDTVADLDFFHLYMEKATELSIWIGRQILNTGIDHPILNEIFLTPEMIRPDAYHELIAPYDRRVQETLGPENAPNSLAAFMGQPGDRDSQRGGAELYRAFFSGVEKIKDLESVLSHRMPGMPFPAAISGRALDSRPLDELLDYLKQVLDYLVGEKNMYPMILLSPVQADSPDKARAIGSKIKRIQALRDSYLL
ncbi:MAG: hypothetical protein K9K82_11955 [Desulfobacteraceae bacterium]|nr:hypothetical protein [Desulfobacteraceae bacterium]